MDNVESGVTQMARIALCWQVVGINLHDVRIQ